MDEMEHIWITVRMGENIRQARENSGLTQAQLAEKVNASQPQIAHYEQGGQDMPLSRLFDLASALGVTAADIFSE